MKTWTFPTPRPTWPNLVLAVAAIAGVTALELVLISRHPPPDAYGDHATVLIGTMSTTAIGLVAWRLRPGNPMGVMILATTLAGSIFLGRFQQESPALYVLYFTVAELGVTVVTAWLWISFPSGRLATRWEKGLVAGFALPLSLLWVATVALRDPETQLYKGAVARDLNPFFEGPQPLYEALLPVAEAGFSLYFLIGVVWFGGRWVRASPTVRRTFGPVLLILAIITVPAVVSTASIALGGSDLDLGWWTLVANEIMWVSLLVGLLRSRVQRSELADLAMKLSERVPLDELRPALASALGDRDLRVGLWVPELNRYVDPGGGAYALAAGQVETPVPGADGPLAVIAHDPTLLDDRELVRGVGAAARMAFEQARLRAELRAQVLAEQDARAGAVAAGDAERRRLERDLHDGAQQRLVSLSVALGLAQAHLDSERDPAVAALVAAAEADARSAVQDLRDLARGLHPRVLVDEGLPGALRALAESAPLPVSVRCDLPGRLPELAETTAYQVGLEALATVARRGGSTVARLLATVEDGTLTVAVEDDGAGDAGAAAELRDISDRVAAVGGRVEFEPAPGRGTLVRARIPLQDDSVPALWSSASPDVTLTR